LEVRRSTQFLVTLQYRVPDRRILGIHNIQPILEIIETIEHVGESHFTTIYRFLIWIVNIIFAFLVASNIINLIVYTLRGCLRVDFLGIL
jgi:hypothetical protein